MRKFKCVEVKASKKEHTCVQCLGKLPIGSRYYSLTYLSEMVYFTTYAHHIDCHEAWLKVNENTPKHQDGYSLRGLFDNNKNLFLNQYPEVYARLSRNI